MDWHLAAPDFDDDGALRDIYILGTTIEDWQAVWTFLRGEGERLTFTVDGTLQEPPEAVGDIFAQGNAGFLASYRRGGQVLNCHFFDLGEIEFDLSPRDVDGPEAVDTLVQFMGALGRVTAKPVILTMENSREAVIARFDPLNGEVTWQPAGG
jgi:hypothetical protein